MMLRLQGLCSNYGSIEVLHGIDLEVNSGEIVTLIGANGAGKTTTLRAITGLVDPKKGSIEFENEDINKLKTHQIVAKGVSMVPEGRAVFANLSVLENLHMGGYLQHDRDAKQKDLEHVYSLFPRLKERKSQTAGTLSGGEQQMLAIGRALMAKPKLLLLDEPSLGLAPKLVDVIFKAIETINSEGTTILLVEQNAIAALKHSHRAYVLETGRIILSGQSSELAADESIRKAYLGEF